MRKSRQMMVQRLVATCAAALLASTAPGGEDSSSLRRGADGFGDVRSAAFFARDGKMDEGRTFIAELRARPSEGRSTEELQSVDMAEFALLRKDVEHNRPRAVECLRTVFDSCPTSFWGWAAYTFLKDMGETVAEPPRDPLRGLGSLAEGVVNLEPRLLEPGTGNRESAGPVPHVACPEKFSLVDFKPGSSTRRAILRHRLIEICGEKKVREILSAEGGEQLFSRIWNDDAVLEDFLLSGPVFDGPLALETLMTLLLNDEKEGWAKTQMGRCATVAVAINAKPGDDIAETVRHWAAFRRLGTLGRFVESTKERDCREWRFIVRRPIDPADILYLNTTRRYPARLRRNVGLQGVPYRKRNCFDVSKWAKNDEFLRPWLASGWPRQYLRSRVGGEKKSLSLAKVLVYGKRLF